MAAETDAFMEGGRVAICCAIAARGSMAIPRMAVTLSAAPVGVLAPLKTLPAWVLVDWAVYAPRRRKIAEGFSLESLRVRYEEVK